MKESEKYNNPSDFSKYAKIQRQLHTLDKKISELSGSSDDEFNMGGIFGTFFKQAKSQFSYFNSFVYLIKILFKMYFIYFNKDKIFYFKENLINNNPNILFESFRDDEGYLNFQIRYIFIAVWIVLF